MIIHHHLGLGDHFVCNGLVNHLSMYNRIHLICKARNEPTVSSLYSSNTAVTIHSIPGDNEFSEVQKISSVLQEPVTRIGFARCAAINWDRSFYDQMNINFINRYSSFRLPTSLPKQLPIPDEKYIFVSNTSSEQSYSLDLCPRDYYQYVPTKDQTDNLLSYIDVISNASEIHCIDSAFFHLIDSLVQVPIKLFFHDIRKIPVSFKISEKWGFIRYE